jgi:hypothetical protein
MCVFAGNVVFLEIKQPRWLQPVIFVQSLRAKFFALRLSPKNVLKKCIQRRYQTMDENVLLCHLQIQRAKYQSKEKEVKVNLSYFYLILVLFYSSPNLLTY